MAILSSRVDEAARQVAVDLLVVMPVYNEQVAIAQVIGEWLIQLRETGASFAILAINDASRDGTWTALLDLEKLHSQNLLVIDHLHSGHGATCRLGYDIAAASSASWVLQIDSDGQCDPVYFSEFWKQREGADAIFGIRKTRGDGLARTATSWACSVASSLLAGTSLADANVPYRLIRVSILQEALAWVPRPFNLQNVALAVILHRNRNVRWRYLPIHFRNRQGGTNSINLFQVARLGLEMLVQIAQLRGPRPAPPAR
jgi:dolichol-phosphate mannosyltransferase